MLQGKRIIIGISGGIAAYKSLILIRLFKKAGAEVRVVTTENALWFVTRVSLESLSQNKIYDKVFGPENDYTTEHISLTDWADCVVVAPATANVIGKLANGIADDALSTSLIAFDKKIFIAPAMNCKMFDHFAVQRNLSFLKENDIEIVEPASGYLACGYEGKGRMEEPEEIFARVQHFFSAQDGALKGKKVLITAGPTHEPIDPVRFVGNYSTGKMGFAIASELAQRGAEVTLIAGPVSLPTPPGQINRIDVCTADEMFVAASRAFPGMDAAILTAAVADFKPALTAPQKIKKNDSLPEIKLVLNPDILASLGKAKKESQVLAGFALETDNELANAQKKLKDKNLDFIVLNSLNDAEAGFGGDNNKVTIIDNKNHISGFELKSKKQVAVDVVDKLSQLL
ncbi:MAG: bifunctional phosphopantothenoylcysteine decarboxylase/phosphopantothenate--cysteine ligase CoaBC [Bacteroidetes bacterium]|nr:MAG: bifunctional phosphopantothenoylcysteine decarboxylase/phosphopantothenate--cysteine ligase CoaBC [Bacteroidota bacterium]